MATRDTYNSGTVGAVSGDAYMDQTAAHLKEIYDASAIALTGVAGTADAVTAVLDPVLDVGGLVDGMKFTLTWGAANTAGVTLAINGGTAIPVKDNGGAALSADSLAAGLRSLIEYLSGDFRILTPLATASGLVAPRYYLKAVTTQVWNKPTGFSDDAILWIELWGAGASGRSSTANANGGAGGGYTRAAFRLGDLPSSLTLTIGTGGAAVTGASGNAGGGTTFGALLAALGGQPGLNNTTPAPGGGSTFGSNDMHFGFLEPGAAGGICGGAAASPTSGDNAIHAGAGGASGNGNLASTSVAGGTSIFGGDGGRGGDSSPVPTAGSAPGGGGGASQSNATPSGAGARGEARLWI